MKRVTAVMVMLTLMILPAHAQTGGGGRRYQGDDKKSEEKKPVADEKAYKAALKKILEPKTKYDPWGMARLTGTVKDPK